MGLQDRDCMRERQRKLWATPKVNWRQKIVIAVGIIALLGAAAWYVPDVQPVIGDYRLAEGSLIVNINTATEGELQTVPGIGPARAAQIIAGRPYANVDELTGIVGIGEKALDGLRPFVTVAGETRAR